MTTKRKKALRLSEIAASYQLSESWLRAAIKRGELPAYRPARSYLVLETDLEDFLAEAKVNFEDDDLDDTEDLESENCEDEHDLEDDDLDDDDRNDDGLEDEDEDDDDDQDDDDRNDDGLEDEDDDDDQDDDDFAHGCNPSRPY